MAKTMKEILLGMIRMYSIIPVLVVGLYSIFSILTGTAPSWWWWATVLGYICIMMLGVSAGYHRLLSHRAFQVHPWTKSLLLWFAALSCQGSPIFWTTIHRGYHHRYTDQSKDPHSPQQGFWHSYILWMFKIRTGDHNTKFVVDILKDPICVFFHKYYNHIIWISHICIAAISVELWLYAVILPAFITINSFALTNTLTHLPHLGYKNCETNNHGVNIVWLFPVVLGEAWHNNHHADAKNPCLGKRWWEIDPTYWLIRLIRTD
jgi:stearoyl-CoA desaturase (delta-9 desaturase)